MPDNSKTNNISPAAIDPIKDKIYTIRGVQVMLDSDLAELYDTKTKLINQSVKRNIERFPDRYFFQLTNDEFNNLRSHFATSSLNDNYGGRRYLPYVFTEQGVAMLAGVLKSDVAIKVSIDIIDAFVSMRHFLADNASIFQRLDRIEMASLEFRSETKPSPSTKSPTKA